MGYDTHFLQLTNSKKEVKGLLVFNQDSSEHTRVNLYHISSSEDKSKFEEVLDLGLDYIYKMMHCSSIRIYLHHFKQTSEDGKEEKIKVNEDLKNLLKQRRFKWKTLKNETSTGQRIEVLEGLNLEYKEQVNADTAFIYRRGLAKEDFLRNTFTLELKSQQNQGSPSKQKTSQNCYSYPALLGSLVLSDPDFKAKLADKDDKLSDIRDAVRSNDKSSLFS